MVAMNEIKRFSREIGLQFDAEQVVLFGSYAQGTATKDSDVDLLVIAPFEGKSVHQSVKIRNGLLKEFKVSLQSLLFQKLN